MFRITSLVAVRRLLYRRDILNINTVTRAAIANYSDDKYKKREISDPCPVPSTTPPPPPPQDDTIFWGAVTLLFLAGGFVVYAKSNPELRDWLSLNAAWIDDLVAIVHQENMTYGDLYKQYFGDMKKAIMDLVGEDRPMICSTDGQVLTITDAPSLMPVDEISEQKPACPHQINRKGNEDLESYETLPHPALAKGTHEIERCVQELGETAIHSYATARNACIYYNKLVEESMVNFKLSCLKKLYGAMNERIAWVNESVENGTTASSKLDEIFRYYERGVEAPMKGKTNTQDMLKHYRDKIKAIEVQWQWQNYISLAKDAQWQKVEAVVDQYAEEIQTMSKGLDYSSEKPFLQGDLDLILHHTLRYVELLRKQLSEALQKTTDCIDNGIESLPQGEKATIEREASIQALYKKSLADLNADYKKRAHDLRVQNENFIRNSLKIQLEQSQETMEQKLKQKEVEAAMKLEEMVAAQVVSEKREMDEEIAAMSTKLKNLELNLYARLKAERETRRFQELWSAGESLLAATKKGDPYVNVKKELEAIEKASDVDDKLVLSVLKAIPKSVREHGVVPENVLKKKYHAMESVAMKVALVSQEGAPLPVYLLSYLQSIFLFMKISGIPQGEFDKPLKELSEGLDTFDLLQRARFWVERGNIAAALTYVTALKGASRVVFSSWQDAARSYLETRQAAEAVLAHAAAMSLQFI